MTAHWGVPDPAKAKGNDAEKAFAFDDCMRMLNQRISIFVNLPLEKLSRSTRSAGRDCFQRAGLTRPARSSR
jgi:hypothetical protein